MVFMNCTITLIKQSFQFFYCRLRTFEMGVEILVMPGFENLGHILKITEKVSILRY